MAGKGECDLGNTIGEEMQLSDSGSEANGPDSTSVVEEEGS